MSIRETGWFFPAPDESELPERLRKLFAKARQNLGFVPNVFRSYAYRPERFSAWFDHYKQLHEPTDNLSAADREMIAIVVSAANHCIYCLAAHGATLREELGDPVLGDRITFDWRRAGLDGRRAAICAYAEKLTLQPLECDEADLGRLREVGLADEEIWDVVEIASMYNFTNRMAMGLGQIANPEYHSIGRIPPERGTPSPGV
ncbi:MAG: peroxidase-related enzyme [Streptosporangiaceae bacterium]